MLIWKIRAMEALTNAKLEVDRAFDTANKALHRLQKELPLECGAVNKAKELTNENEAEGMVIRPDHHRSPY